MYVYRQPQFNLIFLAFTITKVAYHNTQAKLKNLKKQKRQRNYLDVKPSNEQYAIFEKESFVNSFWLNSISNLYSQKPIPFLVCYPSNFKHNKYDYE